MDISLVNQLKPSLYFRYSSVFHKSYICLINVNGRKLYLIKISKAFVHLIGRFEYTDIIGH